MKCEFNDEVCSRKDFTVTDGPGLCCYCDDTIPEGSEASLIVPIAGDGYYRMHRECADEASSAPQADLEAIVRHTAGSMALSGMELSEEDKARILYVLEHPGEADTVLKELIRKHTVSSEELSETEE